MAKYTPDSIYNLVEAYLERRKDLSSIGNSDSSLWLTMVGFFNRHFYQDGRKADPTRFQSTTSFVVSGNGSNTISDLESLDGDGCGVFHADSDGAITNQLVRKTSRSSNLSGCWVDSANQAIVTTGGLTGTIWVVYFAQVAKPADSETDLLLDDNNDEAVIDYFRRLIDIWDNKAGFLNLDDALLQNSMRRLIDNLNPEAPAAIPLNIDSF